MSPDGVFTTVMSQDEAQRALGIIEKRHLFRIASTHYLRHYKMLPDFACSAYIDDVMFFMGRFVRAIAECDECFPALTAARKADTVQRAESTITAKEIWQSLQKGEE